MRCIKIQSEGGKKLKVGIFATRFSAKSDFLNLKWGKKFFEKNVLLTRRNATKNKKEKFKRKHPSGWRNHTQDRSQVKWGYTNGQNLRGFSACLSPVFLP